jgi:hypothetical protein
MFAASERQLAGWQLSAAPMHALCVMRWRRQQGAVLAAV